jgi:hypothetical protein
VNRVLILLAAVLILGGCFVRTGPPPAGELPQPTCGGLKIKIDGALPCDRIVEIAMAALRERAPEQVARGVIAIDVVLSACPRGEVPQQIQCSGVPFVQLVTVSFNPAPSGGPIERSPTVAVDPTSGAILGIENPLIR